MTYHDIIKAINEAKGDKSYYAIHKASGLSKSQTFKILRNESMASVESLIKLAETVCLEIILKKVDK